MRKNQVEINRLCKSIMESVTPEIRKALREAEEKQKNTDKDQDNMDEAELNELFGFRSSVNKPEKALSLDNTDDENADLFIQWCGYYISKAGNNVAKGTETFFSEAGKVIIKAPGMIVKGILMLMSGTIKATVYGVTGIAGIVLSSISMLVRMAVSGVEDAKDALAKLYNNLAKGLKTFYKNFSEDAESFVTSAKDKLTTWMGVITGAISACANKIPGAIDSLGEFFEKVFDDAKDKKNGAVFLLKTWLQSKSQAVKNWISDTAGDIKQAVVSAWNAIDKKARKAYDNVAQKLEDWLQDFQDLVAQVKTKIQDTVKDAKNFAIDTKDKALVWGIQKGVKGLSKKYSEDQVVALVRKCYNESLVPVAGKYRINEAYFYEAGSRQRRLYEHVHRVHTRRILND